jgi:FKBP-type peptidyl-prolyl cis-trans isomerase 2
VLQYYTHHEESEHHKAERVVEMSFEKGDFLLVEYTAKVKETGEVFDTTIEDVAKKERLHKEGEIYEPKLIVVGEGWVLKALDDSLLSTELNKPATIEITPEKAFGPRDPNMLKMVPLRRLRDKGITPQIGMRVEYEKKLATIRTVGAGRVTLDFNPPLAGKTLVYNVTVKRKLEKRKEKILGLIHRRIPVVDISKFKVEIGQAEVVVHVPEEAFYLEGLQLAKRGVSTDIQRFFPATAAVRFIEIFTNPKVADTSEPEAKKRKKQPSRRVKKPKAK